MVDTLILLIPLSKVMRYTILINKWFKQNIKLVLESSPLCYAHVMAYTTSYNGGQLIFVTTLPVLV